MTNTSWTQFCDFPFSDDAELPQLADAWKFSATQLGRLRHLLHSSDIGCACVAVSGSLNRMEGHPKSDLDILIVIDDREENYSEGTRAKIYGSIWAQLSSVPELESLIPPKPGGVFSSCASWKDMTDQATRGIVDADLTTFGQRMQLLLDAQPVSGDAMFCDLRADLLRWYSETRISRIFSESSPLHWLWQDVQRYWRSIRSRACWLHANDPKKSLEVNLKLRSSRLVLIAAFLQAICMAEAVGTTHETLIEALQAELTLSPLQRLASALSLEADRQQLLRSYQAIWAHVAELSNRTSAPPPQILQSIKDLQHCVNQVPRKSDSWMF